MHTGLEKWKLKTRGDHSNHSKNSLTEMAAERYKTTGWYINFGMV
jgi:hypothetical protein